MKRHRRRRFRIEEKHRLLREWSASGLSRREFAARVGVAESSLQRWSRGLETLEQDREHAFEFTQVKVVDGGGTATNGEGDPDGAVEVSGRNRPIFEVVVQSGAVVRVFDPTHARRLEQLIVEAVGP